MGDVASIYPDGVLLALLRSVLDEDGGSKVPPDVVNRAADGYWVARVVPGGSDVDDRFAAGAAVQIDTWAATAREARALCGRALRELRLAQRRQTATEDGHLSTMRVDAWPAEVREDDQPTTWARYVAALSATFRPPAG